ncbi:MAG: hypothetical protein KF752_03060 [Pirellulaceae bacterium]|nr:hypothetical protein [Pirellulaceae bacterium]
MKNKPTQSTAQPILGCVGLSVAGQPTQFVLERAFNMLSLDWRAISVEVEPDKLHTACQGMLAMGFKGLRLLGESQLQAVSSVAANDPPTQFIGRLTSAIRTADSWQWWDNYGYAWIDIVASLAAKLPSFVWLHGDSLTTRSLFAALLDTRSELATNWIWTHPTKLSESDQWPSPAYLRDVRAQILESDADGVDQHLQHWLAASAQPAAKDKAVPNSPTTTRNSYTGNNPQAGATAAATPARLLAFVSESPHIPEETIQRLSGLQTHELCGLILPKELSFPKTASSAMTSRISPADLWVAGEAHDFLRWTGRSVDAHLLRDAYDEYCDF